MTRDELQAEIAYLKRLCIHLRELGLARHWAYSLPKHQAELRKYHALKAELDKLDGDKP